MRGGRPSRTAHTRVELVLERRSEGGREVRWEERGKHRERVCVCVCEVFKHQSRTAQTKLRTPREWR